MNLDGEFNSGDLLVIFQAGEFEDDVIGNSTWATGDWNGDADFDTGDLVFAFRDGGYERGPRRLVAMVPEPSGFILVMLAAVCCMIDVRKSATEFRVRHSRALSFKPLEYTDRR